MSRNKFQREITKIAKQYGYRPDGVTGSGHLRFRHTNGHAVSVSNTPSSPWAQLQIVKIFKKGAAA